MRNFVRDVGIKSPWESSLHLCLLGAGARFDYRLPHGNFVPHVSIAVAEVLLLVDLAVLIYFINHIASSIQLPAVIAGIARDLDSAIDTEFPAVNREISVSSSANPRLGPERTAGGAVGDH